MKFRFNLYEMYTEDISAASTDLSSMLRDIDGPVFDDGTGETTLENVIYLGTKETFMHRVARIASLTYKKGWFEGFLFGLFIATAVAILFMCYLVVVNPIR